MFNWALAGVYIVWHIARGRCFFQELLPDEIDLPKPVWTRVTVVSTCHFFMVGAVNLYVAFNFSLDTWVSFKLWSAVLFTILWAVMIGVIMGPYLKDDLKDDEAPTTTRQQKLLRPFGGNQPMRIIGLTLLSSLAAVMSASALAQEASDAPPAGETRYVTDLILPRFAPVPVATIESSTKASPQAPR